MKTGTHLQTLPRNVEVGIRSCTEKNTEKRLLILYAPLKKKPEIEKNSRQLSPKKRDSEPDISITM
jgi:hypothetical protein